MSTRVQKGSTVFRPVARPRVRPGSESRQTSVVPDTQNARGSSAASHKERVLIDADSSSMPPPLAVPSRPVPVAEARYVPLHTPASSSSGQKSLPHVHISDDTEKRPQPLLMQTQLSSDDIPLRQVTPNTGNLITPLSRDRPVPVLIGHSRSAPVLVSQTPAVEPHHIAHTLPIQQVLIPPDTYVQHQCVDGSQLAVENPAAGLFSSKPTHTRRESALNKGKTITELHDSGDDSEQIELPTKRRRKKSSSQREEMSEAAPKRRKNKDSTTPRRSRTRTPSTPPFDSNADPGEELDPTVTTMSALCDDTGQGRISSKAAQIMTNHAAWQVANKEKRARLRAIMEAKKYGRDAENENQPPDRSSQAAAEATEGGSSGDVASTNTGAPTAEPSSANGHSPNETRAGDDFDYTEDLSTSRYNVQVRIGASGETIIDEQSLFVNRDEEDDTANYTHVEESDTTKFVNSLTYSKKPRGSRWSAEETELFYDALSQFGENYELISFVLPGRDRKACKNKFKAEDKKNSSRITYCLNHHIETLSRMTGKDFSGPTPIIRAPTPLRSTQLDAKLQSQEQSVAPVSADEEVLGTVDDVEKDVYAFEEMDDAG
ncbi:uncharacterized protein FIBRA_06633 [Fibroporia radiculosa]|uniref:Uncharacterized protein n=1 Tax=Fibroporia radiculosa TaxID=599839 RepID=J4GC31_9APHY|nr:uncharacterized protein FIBRA_06633 [Fibroporia radiculosa]CCM04453.1 predicted protein [Fibroporia radiculosa]